MTQKLYSYLKAVALFMLLFATKAQAQITNQWIEVGGTNTSTLNGPITSLVTDASGNVYAVGGFTNDSGKSYVAKWDGSSWQELGGTNSSTFNSGIACLTTDAGGNVYAVAVGGFTNGSNGKHYVAKWNGSSWQELGGTNSSTFNSFILSLATDAGGNVYAAGEFFNGSRKPYVAKWNGSSWQELGGSNSYTFSSNGYIRSLTTDAGGNVYAAGDFKNGNGNNYVAKWNGSSWQELGGTNSSTFNHTIYHLTTDAGGHVYAGGLFSNGLFKYYVAKWNGSSWQELGGANSSKFSGYISSLTTDAGGNVYATGEFLNGLFKHYVAKWNGSSWQELGGTNRSTFNSLIYSVTTDAVGNVYAGGFFTNDSGKCYLAKYGNAVVTIPTISSFTPTTASAGTTVTITGTGFTGATAVSFGGVAATSYTVVSATSITAVVGSGASGSISVTTGGGTASLAGFTFIETPTISSFTPTTANTGTTVTITGTNFSGATAVSFGGTAATSYFVINNTTITALVGAGASGSISVTTSGGTGSLVGFTYQNTNPTIISFTPTTASSGTTVTITGTNFSGATAVSFGGVAATSFSIINSTTITAVVSAGASGIVSVATSGGTVSLGGFTFQNTNPTIISFTPTTASSGTTVTITGTNFSGATAVNFGGVAATSFSVINNTTITAVVSAGASGIVSVATSGGTVSLGGFTFQNTNPTITSFTPTTASTGTTVTITGTNFTGATAVSFGGVAATSFSIINSTTITAVISAGASGSVSVTSIGGVATLAGFNFCNLATSTVSIAASTKSTCLGTKVTFTASPTNEGANPTYQWIVNSNPVGTNSITYSTTSLNDNDNVICLLTSAAACSNNTALSNKIYITINKPTVSTTNASICAGGSYTFNGTNYTTTGTYIAHLVNSKGCDSAATLVLSVKKTSTSTTSISINLGGSYTFNGTSYTTSGTYIAHLTNSVGCDSTVTLLLTVNQNSTSTTNASICEGGTYTFNGNTYNTAGTYTTHLLNSVGNDSVAILILKVNAISKSIINASICAGGSYTFNGTNYTTTGTYIAHLVNSNGCDSAATLVLSVKKTSTSTTSISINLGGSYTFNGTTYTTSGTYIAHLINSAGCDSVATLVLTVNSTSNSTTKDSICEGSSYTFNGTVYTKAGTYVAHLTNTAGFDSAATLVLTIKNPPVVAPIEGSGTVCGGNSLKLTNQTVGGLWESSDPKIASVTNSGNVTGITLGSTTISYSLSNSCGKTSVKKEVVVSVVKTTVNEIEGDSNVCLHKTTTLSNTTLNGLWSSQDASIAIIDNNGRVTGLKVGETVVSYTLTNGCGMNSVSKTVSVSGVRPSRKNITAKNPTCIYPIGGSITVEITGNENPYQFSINGETYPDYTKLPDLGAGTYPIQIFNASKCLVDSEIVRLVLETSVGCDTMYIPTAFTPTNSINNIFKPFGGMNVQSITFRIYNRLGRQLFESHDIYKGWDGMVNGVLQETGTYVWSLQYTSSLGSIKSKQGTLVLLR